jgi:hypothetical protein
VGPDSGRRRPAPVLVPRGKKATTLGLLRPFIIFDGGSGTSHSLWGTLGARGRWLGWLEAEQHRWLIGTAAAKEHGRVKEERHRARSEEEETCSTFNTKARDKGEGAHT